MPDDIEISGIPMPSGEIVYPDPNNKHSDDDVIDYCIYNSYIYSDYTLMEDTITLIKNIMIN